MDSGSAVSTLISAQGFAVVIGREMASAPSLLAGSLSSLLDDAPLDAHVAHPTRFRLHNKLVYLPWNGYLSRLPLPCYYRDLPTWTDFGRFYASIGIGLLSSHAFAKLIEGDFLACQMSIIYKSYPVEIGINLIRIKASEQIAGVSPSNKPHRDGERFIIPQMFCRQNVIGGENSIWTDSGDCVWKGVLREPLDTLFVDDMRLLHHVEPISIEFGFQEGFRDVLIVDATPMPSSKGVSP
jgi:hypothetical protein